LHRDQARLAGKDELHCSIHFFGCHAFPRGNARGKETIAWLTSVSLRLLLSPLALYLKSKASYSLLMKSVISSKGQITVPIKIRSQLGLHPGTVVTFEMTKKGALLRKGGAGTHPVDQLYGILDSKNRTDDLLDELRGPKPGKRRAKRR
jgi:AbrB family looped-hinge helix DNA binding protein